MDDELEDIVFYQTFVTNMRVLSKIALVPASIHAPFAYSWRILRHYVLRPEFALCGFVLIVLLLYLQAVDLWSRNLLGRIQATFDRQRASHAKLAGANLSRSDHESWVEVRRQSAAFAVLGRRPRMEDRFILEENINNSTGISLFAIFDGHGGEFAADFAKDVLVKNIFNKAIETAKMLENAENNWSDYNDNTYLLRRASKKTTEDSSKIDNVLGNSATNRRDSLRKQSYSTTDDCGTARQKDAADAQDIYVAKLNALNGNRMKDTFLNGKASENTQQNGEPPRRYDAGCYIDNGEINFGKLITDEVLAADHKLVEAARKTTNIAGTTALIAIIHGSKLVVANVGDSRGVMCDSRGTAIPLSFDHKPQQVRERKRIHDAGGFIAFRGVWRVAGILATSRAMGDYPLKDKKFVIANPDILTFELNDHKPNFIILASDGLWDTFSNEEACAFIAAHIKEPDFGAKSLVMQSYQRGSVDNITVVVIAFKQGVYRISSSPPTKF